METANQTPDVNEFVYEFLKATANSPHRIEMDADSLREVKQIESYFTFRPSHKDASPTLTDDEKLMLKDLCRMTRVEPPLPLDEEKTVPHSILSKLVGSIRSALTGLISKITPAREPALRQDHVA